MAVVPPGNAVLELMQSATSRVVVAAPYIKSATLRRILEAIPDTVSECVCITRWLPEDIFSGVCDLEIYDDISQTQGGRLLVHPHLHAKYYSNGQNTLVGSANLTSRGLGWYTPSNVELLVSLPADFPGLADWESTLLDSAVEATEQLRRQILEQVEKLRQSRSAQRLPEVDEAPGKEGEVVFWVPQCPVPEQLWEVYLGRGADTMVSSAFKAAQKDLTALSPPPGLTKNLFTAYIAGILRQMPLLTEIDELVSTGLTDTNAQKFLAVRVSDLAENRNGYDQIWRVVKQWLLYFFPDSYRLETGQEVLVKGKELPRR